MDAFTLVAKLTLDTKSFDAKFKEVEGSLEKDESKSGFSAWGTAVGKLAADAFEKAFASSIRVVKDLIRVGMDFESTMSSVKAVGKLTDEQFGKIEKKAMQLGESTKFTAAQVGEAFYYMGLAGWDTEEMLAGIEPVLNLAAASGEDLGRVSDIVTDAITAMGLSADDAANFVNVLAAASTNSNTTVSMMGEAFKYIATTGGVLEYSIEDVALALGLLANNGIKAGQAGTSMRQILNTLIAPSEDAAKAMGALGISLFEPRTNKRKPLSQVIDELRTTFKEAGMDLRGFEPAELQKRIDAANEWYDKQMAEIEASGEDATRKKNMRKNVEETYAEKLFGAESPNQFFLQKLSDIGGLRGISSLFALMKSTDNDVEQLQSAIESSSEGKGAAATMAETMIDNLEGDVTLLNSALDGLKLLVYGTYKEDFRDFVSGMTEEVGRLAAAFNEGGLSGMFTNLTDWIIHGITDTLSNPEITVDGANDFGAALGDFVGNLVAELVTSAPALMSGLFTAGVNIAGGIIKGLYYGLLGSGDDPNSADHIFRTIQEDEQEAIAQAEATAVQAQGIVGYMQSLVNEYGEAASKSEGWANALEKLESLIPGVTEVIKQEGKALSDTTSELSNYIELSKQKAIEDAKKATIASYQKKHEEAQVALGAAQIQSEISASEMQAAAQALADMAEHYYLQSTLNELGELMRDTDLTDDERKEEEARIWGEYNERQNKTAKELMALYESGVYNLKDLEAAAMRAQNEAGEYDQSEINAIVEMYNKAKKEFDENEGKIGQLSQTAEMCAAQLAIAEAAVNRMAGQADSFSAEGLNSAAGNATDALNALAQRANQTGGGRDLRGGKGGGGEDGTHAIGSPYIPYDNYHAVLHRGEQVLTATQARMLRAGGGGSASSAEIAAAVRSAVLDLTMELNGQTVGRVFGDATTRRVSNNMSQMTRRHQYGYGG